MRRASSRLLPQIMGSKLKLMQTSGRVGESIRSQSKSGVRRMHHSPALLPWGIPGMGDEMDNPIQQAAQPERQLWGFVLIMTNLKMLANYSHSMVAGGFELMSYTTRLTPFTLLMISLDILARKS